MHKLPGMLSRHFSATLYFLLCYKFYFSLLTMYLKIKGWGILILNEKRIRGSSRHCHGENCQHVHAAYCRCGEKRCECVFCMCEVRGVGRKCGRCWSTAHPPELSLTAVATEGECGHLEWPAVLSLLSSEGSVAIWNDLTHLRVWCGQSSSQRSREHWGKAEMQRWRVSHWGTGWSVTLSSHCWNPMGKGCKEFHSLPQNHSIPAALQSHRQCSPPNVVKQQCYPGWTASTRIWWY